MKRKADVVVIGGGLAGLTAAREIAQAERSVVVLEARSTPGGRVSGHTLPEGTVIDRGAAFVGPTQDRILALADEFAVERFDTHGTGSPAYALRGDPPGPAFAALAARLDELARAVAADAPWEADDACAHDAQTLDGWMARLGVEPSACDLMRTVTRVMLGAEPHEVSLLFMLSVIAGSGDERNAGTLLRSTAIEDGAQQWRLRGGAHVIPERMAAAIGDDLVLDSPVSEIAWNAGGVHVRSVRLAVQARRAIVTTPPALALRIAYTPALPAGHDQLRQRLPQGAAIKACAVYERPFWREAGLSGEAVFTGGRLSTTYDASPPDGSAGVLTAFVGGGRARALAARPKNERRAAVLEPLAAVFGPAASRPIAYVECDWSEDPWSRGYSMAVPAPGVLHELGALLREPVGPIHWAGTDTSPYWSGYMDGAVRSGHRAAREALEALG